MALLFVAAEPRELAGIARRCGAVHPIDWPVWYARSGELNRKPVRLVANGPGLRLAAAAVRAALERVEADAVISTGFCGSLDPELKRGTVFAANLILNGSGRYAARVPMARSSFRSGVLATVDQVLVGAEQKQDLARTGAEAVDMESAAVAEGACRAGIPFYAVRVILDEADEGFELDFNRLRGADGRFSRWKICRAALARPATRIPELLRIERRGRAAARALGEFIGDCRF